MTTMTVEYLYSDNAGPDKMRVTPVVESGRVEFHFGDPDVNFWLSADDAEHLRTVVLLEFERDLRAAAGD